MKKIILAIAISLAIVSVYSQDKEPSKYLLLSNVYSDSIQPLNPSWYLQSKFLITTQWGGHPRMLQALKFNCTQGTVPNFTSSDNPSMDSNSYNPLYYIWENIKERSARGFTYEPTLYIPPADRGKFITRSLDTTRPIWGFSYISSKCRILPDSNVGNENFSRLIVDRDNFSKGIYTDTILRDVWPKDKFYADTSQSSPETNGTRWILSINLRRLNPDAVKIYPEVELLDIILPCKIRTGENSWSSSKIKFQTQPREIFCDTNVIRKPFYIGDWPAVDSINCLKDEPTDNYDIITIKNSMLPDIDDTLINKRNCRDVTISVRFDCSDYVKNNYQLKMFGANTTYPYIDSIDVLVRYKRLQDSTPSVAINWIRIVTEKGDHFFKGDYDRVRRDKAQNGISILHGKNYKQYLMYTRDEASEDYFDQSRYEAIQYNKCTVSEGAGGDHYDHYDYHVEPQHKWMGCMNFLRAVSAPYRLINADSISILFPYKSFYYPENGYMGLYKTNPMLTSYETDYAPYYSNTDSTEIWKAVRTPNIDTLVMHWSKDYLGTQYVWYGREALDFLLSSGNGILGNLESIMYRSYFKNPKFLYSSKYWWQHSYPQGNWNVIQQNNTPYATLGNVRPQTGEELRMLQWTGLVYGAKGFGYDANCYKLVNNISNKNLGFIGHTDPLLSQQYVTPGLSDDTLIYSDNQVFGVDYIPYGDAATNIDQYMNRTTVCNYLGVAGSRIYYGRKSPKTEMFKLHSYIREVDSSIMDLRLVATYSKMARIYRTCDTPAYTPLDLDGRIPLESSLYLQDGEGNARPSLISVKTRPIGRTLADLPYWETWDSSYFDISIFRSHVDSANFGNKFTIGILNKRTNPMLYLETGRGPDANRDTLPRFMASAELDDSCRKSPWPDYWLEKQFKRHGSRELLIPFNIQSPNPLEHYVLHLQELGGDLYQKNPLTWWFRAPSYHQYIDTTICLTGSLSSRHLPGEGKLVRAEIYPMVHGDGSCGGCSYVDSSITFELKPTDPQPGTNNCCWQIWIKNSGNCKLNSLPVGFEYIGGDIDSVSFSPFGATLPGQKWHSLNTIFWKLDTLKAGDSLCFSTLCVPPCQSFSYKLHIGMPFNDSTYYCDKTFEGNLVCFDDQKFCDSIQIMTVDVYYGNPNDPIPSEKSCCKKIYTRAVDSLCGEIHGLIYNDSILFPFSPQKYNFSDWILLDSLCLSNFTSKLLTIKYLNRNGFVFCTKTFNFICSIEDPDIRTDSSEIESFDLPGTVIRMAYCSPNPAKDELLIYYALNSKNNVSIDIYNVLGNKITNVFNGQSREGINKCLINTSSLVPGSYIIKLTSSGETKTLKFVIQR